MGSDKDEHDGAMEQLFESTLWPMSGPYVRIVSAGDRLPR